jgi:MFS family permease
MALWFSASAAVPSLLDAEQISVSAAAALTSAVQLGFVAGTLTSALFGLADRFDSRTIFSFAAVLGAMLNGALLVYGLDHPTAPILRFATGVCMAGIYPVGMKLAAGWAAGNMGLLMGSLVGAVTLGSAMPHLFYAFISSSFSGQRVCAHCGNRHSLCPTWTQTCQVNNISLVGSQISPT